jgi:hypothetical protein
MRNRLPNGWLVITNTPPYAARIVISGLIPVPNRSVPHGVGMCLRKVIADQYAGICQRDRVRRSLGRAGESLISGEDTDIAMLACALGMGTATLTKLKITHLIPRGVRYSE